MGGFERREWHDLRIFKNPTSCLLRIASGVRVGFNSMTFGLKDLEDGQFLS